MAGNFAHGDFSVRLTPKSIRKEKALQLEIFSGLESLKQLSILVAPSYKERLQCVLISWVFPAPPETQGLCVEHGGPGAGAQAAGSLRRTRWPGPSS